jgi:hypothetical protein
VQVKVVKFNKLYFLILDNVPYLKNVVGNWQNLPPQNMALGHKVSLWLMAVGSRQN